MPSRWSEKVTKAATKWLSTNCLLTPLGGQLLRILQYALACNHLEIVDFNQPHRIPIVERVRQIFTEWSSLSMGIDEGCMIYSTVLRTAKIPGDLAEVGVFRGASAKVICEAKGERGLHLFDTFEGLPPPSPMDGSFRQGQYESSLESVEAYLEGYKNVWFYKGYFPDTADPVSDKAFSFVHLDVDLYESTLACLDFFYPRMSPGGVIISHDYVQFEGVMVAFDRFFRSKPEAVIELSGNQCMVIKMGTSKLFSET